ncbi:hypothetical protein D3C76_1385100 [compost metagenome]
MNRYRSEDNGNDFDFNETNKFFKINNSYVWLDSSKLECDILLLSNILDKAHVLGYIVNNNRDGNFKVVKAIAIYIE